MLKFLIQGSGQAPYTVTAEGQGELFRMFCSCPAGRKGGVFCKHCQALLLGDVSKLVGSADGLPELIRMAQGSPLIEKALTHQPVDSLDKWAQIHTLEDVVAEFGGKLAALGYCWEISRDPGNLPDRLPCDALSVFASFKNGKRQKNPSHVLSYMP